MLTPGYLLPPLPHTQVEVILKTSHLGLSFIDQFQTKADETQLFDRLDLSTNHYLGKNIQLLMDCVDHLSQETQKCVSV